MHSRTRLLLCFCWAGLTGCALDQSINRIPSPPQVTLDGPDDVVRQDSGPISFLGTVRDLHDAPGDMELQWELDDARHPGLPEVADEDGEAVAELPSAGLDVGWHELKLIAIDSDGDYGWAWAEFEVAGPGGAPSVEITAPADGAVFLAGEQITFRGLAEDAATPADELRFLWESSLDGELGDGISDEGESVLFTDLLSEGTHEITLLAEDLDGEVGQDAISIVIGERDPDDPNDDEPVDAEPGDLVLSEFMVNPGVVYDVEGEWFELYNTSGSPIEIRGYTLRDEDYDEWLIDESMVIGPGEFFLVCANTNPAENGGVTACDAGFLRPQLPPPGLAFGNNGDELILVRPDGVEIDRLEYDAAWVKDAKATGVDPDFLDSDNNDVLSNWCVQTSVITSGGEPGTPGQMNDHCP